MRKGIKPLGHKQSVTRSNESSVLEVQRVKCWRLKWEAVVREDLSEKGTLELRPKRWEKPFIPRSGGRALESTARPQMGDSTVSPGFKPSIYVCSVSCKSFILLTRWLFPCSADFVKSLWHPAVITVCQLETGTSRMWLQGRWFDSCFSIWWAYWVWVWNRLSPWMEVVWDWSAEPVSVKFSFLELPYRSALGWYFSDKCFLLVESFTELSNENSEAIASRSNLRWTWPSSLPPGPTGRSFCSL